MRRDERDGEREHGRDEALRRLLAQWSASPVPDGMDDRMLAAYRRHAGGAQPWWKRFLTASVRVPLPVAVGLLVLLIGAALVAGAVYYQTHREALGQRIDQWRRRLGEWE